MTTNEHNPLSDQSAIRWVDDLIKRLDKDQSDRGLISDHLYNAYQDFTLLLSEADKEEAFAYLLGRYMRK